MAEFKQLKLSLPDPKNPDSMLETVDLELSSTRRASRVSNVLAAGSSGTDPAADAAAEIKTALKNLSKLAKLMADVLRKRLADPQLEALRLQFMRRWYRSDSNLAIAPLVCGVLAIAPLVSGVLSLDLRKMAFDDSYVDPAAKAKEPLRRLYAWLATRFQDEKGQPIDTDLNDMPPFDVVWEQFLRLRGETMVLLCTFSVTNHRQSLLSGRLRIASGEASFKHWKGASGTVIMKDVFTNPRFYMDCGDYLYLFQHCATKTMCEAVVEGMGGCWDRSSPADLHPNFFSGIE